MPQGAHSGDSSGTTTRHLARRRLRPLGLPPAQLRTGIHTGEVAKRRDGDLFGDEANIASRLQGVAEPAEAASRLSDGFEYGSDYFWSLPVDSPEWHRLRSSLSAAGSTLFIGREYALEVIEDARVLDAEVRSELESR